MFGKKLWFGKKELLKFGVQECYLSKKESERIYMRCIESLKGTITEMENYLQKNSDFKNIGSKMLDVFRLSLDEKTYKELPNEFVRNWN